MKDTHYKDGINGAIDLKLQLINTSLNRINKNINDRKTKPKDIIRYEKDKDRLEDRANEYRKIYGLVNDLDMLGHNIIVEHGVSSDVVRKIQDTFKYLPVKEQVGLLSAVKDGNDKKKAKRDIKEIKDKYKEVKKAIKKMKLQKSLAFCGDAKMTVSQALDALRDKFINCARSNELGINIYTENQKIQSPGSIVQALEILSHSLGGEKFAPAREYLEQLEVKYQKQYDKERAIEKKNKPKEKSYRQASKTIPNAKEHLINKSNDHTVTYRDTELARVNAAAEVAARRERERERRLDDAKAKEDAEARQRWEEVNSYTPPGRTK